MQKQNNNRKQGSQYDKIIRENLEVTLPVIVRDVLNLDVLVSEELPDDIQHTKERKPDSLKKITDTDGNTYVLQVEFQLEDEKEMVYRMAEYNIMLMRKYQLPIKQYVIFLKEKKPGMSTFLDTPNHKYHYNLILITDIDYKLFIKSDTIEVKILGILANFGKQNNQYAINYIIKELKSLIKGDFARSRYFNQLRILAQLRKSIKLEFENTMQSISTFFKEEDDFFYQRGKKETKEKMSHAVIKNLIIKLGLTDEQAADIIEVDVNFVKNIRAELNNK
ncbi:hypothetical protein SAMN05421820_102316 [Pedobacter steynii]|uniref:Transposase (putative) YhgA-like domain-containing protein n=1 Tax=Pedobacter steynii TaxID=430522 RepID=A0A1G9NFT5_9SPHI|nr:hypothetical protein [Pedobacter steynii]NQX39313.1 hypothetical protein [Pedobacter steynii]SDL85416.1 hypothetical protein SAMN05421820_102316 [Pedobacter steynii]